MAIRDFTRMRWVLLTVVVVAVLVVAAAFILLRTMPPRNIVMATGPEGGAYHLIGRRYQAILAHAGVRLRLVSTTGALQNLALLRDPHSGVGIALIQGGTTSEAEAPDIESLGTVFYEPLWTFYRGELRGLGLNGLRGRKISIGPEGSGMRMLSLELLKRSGIDGNSAELLGYSPQDASAKLLSGEIDAVIMPMSWESPVVQQLLADERVELLSFPDTDAYATLYPYLSKLVVPAGVGDIVKQRPPADVTLLAPKASLVVRKDVHPAIQYLLLNTAVQVHSVAGVFRRAGQFPAAEAIDVPLSDEAAQFYKSGRPFLQNYLPFWIASLVARLLVLLIPIIGVLYPLLRFIPAIYGWMALRKIARLYGELRFLEAELNAQSTVHDAGSTLARLDRLEEQANQLRIPTTYASMQYMLRDHIGLVRARLGDS
jgi:TRAP transporter TAXI family solute receptor